MRNRLAWIGSVFTIIYLIVFISFIFGRLPELQTMALNNIGDFLAGAFGPIAFFWLVLGFMQQGTELRVSTEALRMQADELKASVLQQTALATAQQVSLENHEKSLEPILLLKYTGNETIEGDEYCGFSLKNLGVYCESVYVQLYEDGVEKYPMSLDSLYNGVERGFLLADFVDDFSERVLKVSYVKVSGRDGKQFFKVGIFAHEDGYYASIKKLLNYKLDLAT